MRTYAPARPRPSSTRCSTSRRSPAASSTTPSSRREPAVFGDVPGLARPADRGRPRVARHRAACTPTRRRRSRPSTPARTSSSSRRRRRARRSATRCRSSRRSPTTRRRGRSSCSRPRRSARTRSPSSRSCRGRPACRSRRRPTTATRRRRSGRRSASAGQVVVTNPDMLHSAILPHHTKWFQLFEQLRVIVIDELHTYRGVFGSHVANVLRRLLRICAHYGSHPVIVCCSATIGNPAELAEMLTGRPARLIDRNGAPAGERHVLLVDPPLLDPASGARGSAVTLAERWALPFLRAGRQTIVFGRSRVAVEILLTGLRESLREGFGPRSRVRGYRGGYLPTERRAIERGLRDGEILGVVATNALELGVDIGRLDVVDPGRLPGLDRRRRGSSSAGPGGGSETSVAVLVASGAPVDQYVDPPPGVPARGHAGGGAGRPGQPPRPARPPARGDVRAAVRAGRGVRAGAGRRPARVPRRGGPRPPGRRRALVLGSRELPGLGDLAADRRPGERRDHRHDARTGRGSSARSTCSPPRSSSTSTRSTSTSRSSTTSTSSTGASARRTSTRSTSTTTRTPTGR